MNVCAGLEGEGLVAGRYLCDMRVDVVSGVLKSMLVKLSAFKSI
jgi:hypothetical protein